MEREKLERRRSSKKESDEEGSEGKIRRKGVEKLERNSNLIEKKRKMIKTKKNKVNEKRKGKNLKTLEK